MLKKLTYKCDNKSNEQSRPLETNKKYISYVSIDISPVNPISFEYNDITKSYHNNMFEYILYTQEYITTNNI